MINTEVYMADTEQIFEKQNKNGYLVSTDQEKLNIELIHNWLSTEAHWSLEMPIELVKRAIEHSLCFGIYSPEGDQVGFGRIVTDFTTFAWVTDVFVLKAYRGQGLARFLMESMRAHPDLQVLRRWLLGTSHAAGFYQKLGFEPLENPETYFTIHISDMYQRGLHQGKF